jgi:hypothetical protein
MLVRLRSQPCILLTRLDLSLLRDKGRFKKSNQTTKQHLAATVHRTAAEHRINCLAIRGQQLGKHQNERRL